MSEEVKSTSSAEVAWLSSMNKELSFTEFYNIIDGKPSTSKKTCHAVDPANREALWEIPCADEKDVDDAVKAARKAFKPWKNTPFQERVQALKAWGEACRPYLKQFGEVIMKENGKPVGSGSPSLAPVIHVTNKMAFKPATDKITESLWRIRSSSLLL